MADRELLIRVKELYEKEGGLIIRFLDRKKQISTWIRKNAGNGISEQEEPVPEEIEKQVGKLEEKVRSQGTALWEGENGEILFLEMAGKEDRLVICGAGYVGFALAKLAVFAGIRTIVLEDRDDFARHAGASGAQKILCGPFEEVIQSLDDEVETAYVVMTRGHAFDRKCLLEIAKKQSYYVGMMGSRTRAALIREDLEKAGIEKKWTECLHSPIGLSIGAQTPEEIAVSVLAEILLERGRSGYATRSCRDVFGQALQSMEEGERFVLSTILERKGSAPRKEGTHFIVSESGKIFGTIGGGKLEADIIRSSGEMMKSGERVRIEESDLNNRDAAEEGLVCGGHVRVLMEAGENR